MFAKAIVDKVRSSSAAMEKAGKLSPFVLDFIYKEKLFKLFVPKEAGGKMLSLPDALRIFEEAPRIDGNLGWAVTIGSGGGYFYAYMQTKTAKKVFTDKRAVIAGSGHPSAIAVKAKGGYNVTGQWKYASGAPYATAFTANAMLKGSNKMLAFTFSPSQVAILKDWNAFGMRATESHSFRVTNAFVPNDMTFDLSNNNIYYKSPIYQYPFLQFAETSFAAVAIGLGKHFIEEAHSMLKNYKTVWGAKSERYRFVKAKIKHAEQTMQETIETFYAVADKSWDKMLKEDKLKEKLQHKVSKTSCQTSRVMLACADELIQYLGMQAVMQDSNINRVWRDMHTACQHVLLVPTK